MSSSRPPDATIKLMIVGAWVEYRESCRRAPADRYERVEEWAWSRLRTRLEQLRELAKSPASAE
jgi:hypothetical protein